MGMQFWFTLMLIFHLALANDWKPLNLGITYHGNSFQQQQQPAQDRYVHNLILK